MTIELAIAATSLLAGVTCGEVTVDASVWACFRNGDEQLHDWCWPCPSSSYLIPNFLVPGYYLSLFPKKWKMATGNTMTLTYTRFYAHWIYTMELCFGTWAETTESHTASTTYIGLMAMDLCKHTPKPAYTVKTKSWNGKLLYFKKNFFLNEKKSEIWFMRFCFEVF